MDEKNNKVLREIAEKMIINEEEKKKAQEGWELAKNKNALLQKENEKLNEVIRKLNAVISDKDAKVGSLMKGLRASKEREAEANKKLQKYEAIEKLQQQLEEESDE